MQQADVVLYDALVSDEILIYVAVTVIRYSSVKSALTTPKLKIKSMS